ncbi:MAG: branched-chain amino acid aminotransferase [Eubacteriales bacterium]|nr:branched-chain amino acid aminotransferase [Eubacteriales bacterium]MDD3882652.1 branched-chain amino acid aminotransferase [Eubacteriales bacterium]MDD4512776.1 branched-chain amino acid aminotransferase [Eubacteriales bacterium]
MEIKVALRQERKEKPSDESKLGFGKVFTDHMFLMSYDRENGWHDAKIVPYGPFAMEPSSMVFHYSQSVFEGMKAYRREDGGIQLFRPRDNFKRMNVSNQRLCIPQLNEEDCLQGLIELLKIDKDWVPSAPNTSLYIRPTIIATDAALGVNASNSYLFFIILSPSGSYYASGLKPVSIYVEDKYVRAVRGGVGFTKTGGNYASSILAGDEAHKRNFSQVLWLDGVEQRYVEEVGSMNMFFVFGKKLVTPALNGSILPGITRDSVIKLAKKMGYEVEEKRIDIEEIRAGAKDGTLTEAFGSGTAAVVSPVGRLRIHDEDYVIGKDEETIGELTQKLYDTLTGIQYGRLSDDMNWIVKVD